LEEGTRGRETQTKSIVAIAVEIRNPKGFGRVRMQSVVGDAAPLQGGDGAPGQPSVWSCPTTAISTSARR